MFTHNTGASFGCYGYALTTVTSAYQTLPSRTWLGLNKVEGSIRSTKSDNEFIIVSSLGWLQPKVHLSASS